MANTIMEELAKLKPGLAVNLQALHENAQEQADLAEKAGELAAEAKAEMKRMRLRLDEKKATVQAAARKSPESFGIDKLTENAIAAAVTADPSVHLAEEELIEAELVAGKAESLANAYEHRRSMLNAEVKLWLSNYWGDVHVNDRNLAAGADDVQEKKVLSGLKRRRLVDSEDE